MCQMEERLSDEGTWRNYDDLEPALENEVDEVSDLGGQLVDIEMA